MIVVGSGNGGGGGGGGRFILECMSYMSWLLAAVRNKRKGLYSL